MQLKLSNVNRVTLMKTKQLKVFYGTKNLRSINLPLTELRPITVLVGKNNVGKSTLLRSVPLIKQSIERKRNGPISWFGDLVDYGGFETAVRKGASEEGISFQFGVENFTFTSDTLYFGSKDAGNQSEAELELLGLAKINVHLKQFENQVVRWNSSIELSAHDLTLDLKPNVDGRLETVTLNNQTLPSEFNEFSFRFPDNHILSSIIPVNINEGSNTILEESQFRDIFVKSIFKILDSNIKLQVSNKPIHVEVTKFEEG